MLLAESPFIIFKTFEGMDRPMRTGGQGQRGPRVKEGTMTAVPPGTLAHKVDRPESLIPLISICLSELRRDLRLLIDSKWAESHRLRASELAAAIEEACDRHGLKALSILARSVMNLTRLSPEEAVPLSAALREKLEELLNKAARVVSEESMRRTA
jgi:hypothetical protein